MSAAPGRFRRLLATSPGSAAMLVAVVLPLMFLGDTVATWAAFGAVLLFSAADPLLILRRGSWWLGATLSVPSWLFVFLALAGTANAVADLREGATIFVLPMMVYPVALAISALVRLVVWGVGRGTKPQT